MPFGTGSMRTAQFGALGGQVIGSHFPESVSFRRHNLILLYYIELCFTTVRLLYSLRSFILGTTAKGIRYNE